MNNICPGESTECSFCQCMTCGNNAKSPMDGKFKFDCKHCSGTPDGKCMIQNCNKASTES